MESDPVTTWNPVTTLELPVVDPLWAVGRRFPLLGLPRVLDNVWKHHWTFQVLDNCVENEGGNSLTVLCSRLGFTRTGSSRILFLKGQRPVVRPKVTPFCQNILTVGSAHTQTWVQPQAYADPDPDPSSQRVGYQLALRVKHATRHTAPAKLPRALSLKSDNS